MARTWQHHTQCKAQPGTRWKRTVNSPGKAIFPLSLDISPLQPHHHMPRLLSLPLTTFLPGNVDTLMVFHLSPDLPFHPKSCHHFGPSQRPESSSTSLNPLCLYHDSVATSKHVPLYPCSPRWTGPYLMLPYMGIPNTPVHFSITLPLPRPESILWMHLPFQPEHNLISSFFTGQRLACLLPCSLACLFGDRVSCTSAWPQIPCSRNWLWTSNPSVWTSKVLKLQMCTTAPSLLSAVDGT